MVDGISGNSEEYDNPDLYDAENDSFQEDVPFLAKWAVKSTATIVDLACGTGRVTIPLAKKGYKLIGVDKHRGMLKKAKQKAELEDIDIEWVEQDCTRLNLDGKIGLVYSVGNSFQHFLTNEAQDQLLRSVYNQLEPNGLFIFDTRYPSKEELLQPTNVEEFWRSYSDPVTSQLVDVYTMCSYDGLNQLQHYTTIRRYKETLDEKKTNITLRYVFPKEMERLLLAHGFDILHVYKDWQSTPIDNDAYQMIYVCRKRE